MNSEPLAARELVWLDFKGKQRWAIVLVVDPENEMATVIHGTSRERDYPCVQVDHATRNGQALRLRCTTYFYRSGVESVPFTLLKRRGILCPLQLFMRLREIAELG